MGRVVVVVPMRAQHGVGLATASLTVCHDADVVPVQERGQHGLHFIKHCLLRLCWVVHPGGGGGEGRGVNVTCCHTKYDNNNNRGHFCGAVSH